MLWRSAVRAQRIRRAQAAASEVFIARVTISLRVRGIFINALPESFVKAVIDIAATRYARILNG